MAKDLPNNGPSIRSNKIPIYHELINGLFWFVKIMFNLIDIFNFFPYEFIG
jgi:hypothetical protein